MANDGKPLVIALEEHYRDPALGTQSADREPPWLRAFSEKLNDLGTGRLQAMDEAGIQLQVLSHVPSAIQQANPETAVELAMAANDRLHQTVLTYPERFAAFAALPTPDPPAAAEELERTVTTLGFKGAMIHGRTQGLFHDDKRFWPIFERAQALDVPIYLHPGPPHPGMVEAYYGDYLQDFPALNAAAWGFTIDTANQALRLILSGLFAAYPRLKVILGHLGEGLPFVLDRIDAWINQWAARAPIALRDIFCENFYITTSGQFSTPALLCSILEVGIDRVLFSVDWPFEENRLGTRWMETVPLSAEDKQKLLNGNARRLLKL
jgi:predicted TIM-barrel fold metal-dependent hydrolase